MIKLNLVDLIRKIPRNKISELVKSKRSIDKDEYSLRFLAPTVMEITPKKVPMDAMLEQFHKEINSPLLKHLHLYVVKTNDGKLILSIGA